ncbi:uncharacterized protein LOC129572686, partial [Sitodiplosis mosellana]|uniref:uncharacterized protein LOC129572686 n=1 Tax=Sitodiplosis mosellana TaxID=263140 RepID=UPI0024444191
APRSPFTIDGIVKLVIALRFYATAAHYEMIGDLFGISRTTVEFIIEEVSFLISDKLREHNVFMPSTEEEILDAKVGFMRLADFPLCIAAVDGTHVLINSFGVEDAELYRNRKTTFSLNVQLAVSADERIVGVVSRWPGSAHDSTIFTNSNLCDRLRQREFGHDSVIVVDSAYPPEKFACKPLNEPETLNETVYNNRQIKARNVAERLNGQLKKEYPILKYGMEE